MIQSAYHGILGFLFLVAIIQHDERRRNLPRPTREPESRKRPIRRKYEKRRESRPRKIT